MRKKVFLGGTCNDSTWRQRLIPMIESEVDYFDPVVDDWDEEAHLRECRAKEECVIHLYCVTPLMTGCYTVAEVVESAFVRGPNTIFCLLREDDGKRFSDGQWRSLERVGRIVVQKGGWMVFSLDDVANILTTSGVF